MFALIVILLVLIAAVTIAVLVRRHVRKQAELEAELEKARLEAEEAAALEGVVCDGSGNPLAVSECEDGAIMVEGEEDAFGSVEVGEGAAEDEVVLESDDDAPDCVDSRPSTGGGFGFGLTPAAEEDVVAIDDGDDDDDDGIVDEMAVGALSGTRSFTGAAVGATAAEDVVVDDDDFDDDLGGIEVLEDTAVSSRPASAGRNAWGAAPTATAAEEDIGDIVIDDDDDDDDGGFGGAFSSAQAEDEIVLDDDDEYV